MPFIESIMSAGNGSGDASQRHKKRRLFEHRAMGEHTAREHADHEPAHDLGNGLSHRNPHQPIHQLLEPFSREQLLDLLTSAAARHEDVLHEIKTIANADVSHRKVFVRGLAWETTSERLTNAFAIFGDVQEGAVIYEKSTGKSRGYGFVTFVDMESAQRAVERQVIEIDGRRATCNIAAVRVQSDDQGHHQHQHQHQHHHYQQAHTPPHMRGAAQPPYTVYTAPPPQPVSYAVAAPPPVLLEPSLRAVGDEADRKLFVRGLSWDTVDESLHAELSQYGEVVEASVVRDRKTGKSKGFGFVTFVHPGAAANALQQPHKVIDGRSVTCNLASLGRASSLPPASSRPGSAYGAPPPAYQPDPYAMYPPVNGGDPYHQQGYVYSGGQQSYAQHQYYAPPPPGPVAGSRRQ